MKITSVEMYLVRGPSRNYQVVVVDTDEGISGIGEAGLTHKELAAFGALEHFKPLLIGEDPTRIEHIWQILFRIGSYPANKIAASVVSAIDIALWDILGKSLGLPIYKLLGGAVRDKVVCYPHNRAPDFTIEPLVEDCLRTREEGWKFARWDLPKQGSLFEPGPSVRQGLRQMEAVRAALGDDAELILDVHTRLDPADAIAFCRQVEQFHPFFIEDPLRSENTHSFRHLRQHVDVPIATGELYAGKWEFQEIVEQDLIDYCRLDLCVVGGFTEARKIGGWCETHFIKMVPHNPLGPISSAACLHYNLSCSNFGVQEQPHRPGTLLPDVFPVQIEWQDGYLLPPTRPGLGIEFDREAARHRAFQMADVPRVWRADGATTNY